MEGIAIPEMQKGNLSNTFRLFNNTNPLTWRAWNPSLPIRWVIIADRFSKAVHFVTLSNIPTAWETAELLVNHVFCLHSIPLDTVQFIMQVWKVICLLTPGITQLAWFNMCTIPHCLQQRRVTLLPRPSHLWSRHKVWKDARNCRPNPQICWSASISRTHWPTRSAVWLSPKETST